MQDPIVVENLVKHGKHFCVLPWVHFHSWPDGRVMPCCVADSNMPVADIKENESIIQMMNSEDYKRIRSITIPTAGTYKANITNFATSATLSFNPALNLINGSNYTYSFTLQTDNINKIYDAEMIAATINIASIASALISIKF